MNVNKDGSSSQNSSQNEHQIVNSRLLGSGSRKEEFSQIKEESKSEEDDIKIQIKGTNY